MVSRHSLDDLIDLLWRETSLYWVGDPLSCTARSVGWRGILHEHSVQELRHHACATAVEHDISGGLSAKPPVRSGKQTLYLCCWAQAVECNS